MFQAHMHSSSGLNCRAACGINQPKDYYVAIKLLKTGKLLCKPKFLRKRKKKKRNQLAHTSEK